MKKLNYYLRLEYPFRVEPDPEGGFIASIPDLPGCYAAGETKQEAVERLEESKAAWLESYHAIHGEAPEPRKPEALSGRILLRLPKYLHRKLHHTAQEEGVSVNQYIVATLAAGVSRAEVAGAVRSALEPFAAWIQGQSSQGSGMVVTSRENEKPEKTARHRAYSQQRPQWSGIGEKLRPLSRAKKRPR